MVGRLGGKKDEVSDRRDTADFVSSSQVLKTIGLQFFVSCPRVQILSRPDQPVLHEPRHRRKRRAHAMSNAPFSTLSFVHLLPQVSEQSEAVSAVAPIALTTLRMANQEVEFTKAVSHVSRHRSRRGIRVMTPPQRWSLLRSS